MFKDRMKYILLISIVFVLLAEIASAGQWTAGVLRNGNLYIETHDVNYRAVLRFWWANERKDSPTIMIVYDPTNEWAPDSAIPIAKLTVGDKTVGISFRDSNIFADVITNDFLVDILKHCPNLVYVNTIGPSLVFSLDGFPKAALAMSNVIEGNK